MAEEGCICLWRLKSVLESKKKRVKVNPLCVLEWCQTETLYLNLGGSKKGGCLRGAQVSMSVSSQVSGVGSWVSVVSVVGS